MQRIYDKNDGVNTIHVFPRPALNLQTVLPQMKYHILANDSISVLADSDMQSMVICNIT